MLIYADIEQLTEIAKRYDCICSSHSKHELIQSILSHSYRDDITVMQFNKMSEQQKHLLSILLFEERKKYSLEELKAKIKYCKFIEQKKVKSKSKKVTKPSLPLEDQIVKQLKDEGWIFRQHGASHFALYEIPEDKSEFFRRHLAIQIKQNLTSIAQVEVVRDEAGYILEDLKLLLHFVKQHDITINELLLMNKRTLQQILNSFLVNERIPGKGAWKFGYGKKFGDYPDRFALLYQFTVFKGLITENETLQLTNKGEEKLQDCNEQDTINMIEYWLTIYKKPIPNLKALSYFLMVALEDWRNVDELQNLLLPYIKAYYFDNEEAILQKRILKMLLHFGVVMLGQDDSQALAVKLTPYGKQWLTRALKISEKGKFLTQH